MPEIILETQKIKTVLLAKREKLLAKSSQNPLSDKDVEGVRGARIHNEAAPILVDKERALLADIEQALLKIEAGTFGFCSTCQDPIPTERLNALIETSGCFQVPLCCIPCQGNGRKMHH